MLAALSAGGAPAAGGRGALSGGAAGRATCRSRKAQASPRAGWMSLGPGAGRRRSGRCGTPPQSAARLSSWRARAGPCALASAHDAGAAVRHPIHASRLSQSCAACASLSAGRGSMPAARPGAPRGSMRAALAMPSAPVAAILPAAGLLRLAVRTPLPPPAAACHRPGLDSPPFRP